LRVLSEGKNGLKANRATTGRVGRGHVQWERAVAYAEKRLAFIGARHTGKVKWQKC
jgi:hypothetical protein